MKNQILNRKMTGRVHLLGQETNFHNFYFRKFSRGDFKSLVGSTLSVNNNSALEDREIPDTEILRNFQRKMDEKGSSKR